MIEICFHLIHKSEIIGIGPLMSQRSNDPVQSQIYNTRQLWFWLHLKNQSFKVESDLVSLNNEKNKEYLDTFKTEYDKAKFAVIELLSTGLKATAV